MSLAEAVIRMRLRPICRIFWREWKIAQPRWVLRLGLNRNHQQIRRLDPVGMVQHFVAIADNAKSYEREPTTTEEGPDRADAGFHVHSLPEAGPASLDRHVGLGFDQWKRQILMRVEVQPSRSPLPARRELATVPWPANAINHRADPTWSCAAA